MRYFNPSLVRFESDLLLFYRYQHRFQFATNLGSVNTTNLGLVKLNSKLKPAARRTQVQIPKISERIISFEDPRAFVWRNDLYVMHNQSCFSDHTWSTSIVLGRFNSGSIEQLQVPAFGQNLNLAAINGAPAAYEKNWTPTVVGDDLFMVYQINPLVVIKYDDASRSWLQIETDQTSRPIPYKTFISGSTPLIPWRDDEYIGLFHTYEKFGDNKRLYSMGFYTVDINRWRLTGISHRPTLTAWKNRWRDTRLRGFIKDSPDYLVVFPAGIVDLGKSLAVSYGWNDCRCYISAHDKQDVSDSLITIG
jgi:predicted GH43/DUF377 family glycosyl hydrolase